MIRLVGGAVVAVASFAVPLAVVERNEDETLANAGQANGRLDAPSRGLDADDVAFADAEPLGIGLGKLDPDVRARPRPAA